MIAVGSFLSGDVVSVPATPTRVGDLTYASLSDGWFHDLRMTNDVEAELSSDVKMKWDWDTIFHAKFDNNTMAGNVNWKLEDISYLLIKRKKEGDFKWTTIKVIEVSELGDYNIEDIDFTAQPGYTYLYAAVPILNNLEGDYCVDTVDVKTSAILVADSTAIWYTIYTNNYFDNVSVTPNSVVDTMYNVYPTVIRNSDANYEQVTVQAEFMPDYCEEDYWDVENAGKRTAYRKQAKLFLRNGRNKILKSIDGGIWLVQVTTPPTDSAQNDTYLDRLVEFVGTEVGDPDSEEDLYNSGIIDVTAEWWSYCDNQSISTTTKT